MASMFQREQWCAFFAGNDIWKKTAAMILHKMISITIRLQRMIVTFEDEKVKLNVIKYGLLPCL